MSTNEQEPRPIRVVEPSGCGNAPRHEVIRTFVLSLFQAGGTPEESLRSLLSPDVSWDIVGESTSTGIDAVFERADKIATVDEIRISSILTHGREGGVDGEFHTVDGVQTGFCHVLRFASTAKTAKIRTVRTYMIRID